MEQLLLNIQKTDIEPGMALVGYKAKKVSFQLCIMIAMIAIVTVIATAIAIMIVLIVIVIMKVKMIIGIIQTIGKTSIMTIKVQQKEKDYGV